MCEGETETSSDPLFSFDIGDKQSKSESRNCNHSTIVLNSNQQHRRCCDIGDDTIATLELL